MNRSPSVKKTQTPSDEQLVSQTLAGDRNSYRTLVERYQDKLLRISLEIVKNTSDAEDIAQESFVKAFLSLDKFKGQSSFFTWLYRITFNMAVDFKRKAQRRGGSHFEYKEHLSVSTDVRDGDNGDRGGEQAPLSQNVEGPHEALVRKEAGRKIDQVFAQLSEEHRAVIMLREVDGLDYEEIASVLGVPRGTVMSRLFYARKALQRALSEFAPDSIATPQGEDRAEQESGQQTPLIERVSNYSANGSAISLAPIKGQLGGAKRIAESRGNNGRGNNGRGNSGRGNNGKGDNFGDNSYSPKKGTPNLGNGEKEEAPE